jgi:hypothetical protein
MTLKCKSCIHYYRTMATGAGYNPAPYCHLWEDTGRTPNILTQECYEKRKPPKRQKRTKK